MYRWLSSRSTGIAAVAVAALIALAGCGTSRTARQGEHAVQQHNWDAAVYHYLELVAREPDNIEYRIGLERARQKAAQEHFRRGVALSRLGQLMAARSELRMAVQLDPTHQYAGQVLEDVEHDLEVLARPGGTAELEELKRRAREAKVKPPVLDPASKEPITLNFPKPKPVKEIYRAMAKAYGFNVVFDAKLRDDKLAIELNDVTAERALELVMQHAGHFYKVLDSNTIIIAEDTAPNRREYEDLVIKTFFLSNADVKEVDKLLRSLIEARRLATNEQLNAITLRDTADKVAIAEKLIAVTDKAKAEVLVDVELLELDTGNTSNLGSQLSTYTYTLGIDLDRVPGERPGDSTLYLDQLRDISQDALFINVPSLVINLIKSSDRATSLAQPQMRITEGEKGTVHIGQREPIPVTSFNTSSTVGTSVVPITSFQYQDVGIKIEVEPRVHHNQEVTLNLSVEVSSITGERTSGEQSLPVIGTRNIQTVIRLKDGETNMLVGLYKEDTTQSNSETPGLSAIPLIGRLFTNTSKQRRTTDLVLTLTPHIIRFPDITEEDLAPVWVGTESKITFAGARSPRIQSGRVREGPFDRGDEEEQEPAEDEQEPAEDEPDARDLTEAVGAARSRLRSPSSPFGARRVPTPPREDEGVELVPDGNEKSRSADPAGDDDPAVRIDPTQPPLVVGLEPSVVSLEPGERTVLQVVVSDAPSAYRVPIEISYDADRVAIESIEPAPGAELLTDWAAGGDGLVGLDLAVEAGRETAHAVAAIVVRALAPGPVPLIVSSAGADGGDGVALPVATTDGALFVAPTTAAREP